jgi:adenylate kinase family enzyme
MRIYIVGAVVSGKATLARQLSGALGIPCYSFDEVVHITDKSSPWGNRKRPVEERDNLLYSIISQNDWIVEDTGRPCFEEALKEADTIILLEKASTTIK